MTTAAAPDTERHPSDLLDRAIQAIFGVSLQLENCIHLVDESPRDAKAQLDLAVVRLNGLIRYIRSQAPELGSFEAPYTTDGVRAPRDR